MITILHRYFLLTLLIFSQTLIGNNAFASHDTYHAKQNGYFGLAGIQLDEVGYDISGAAFMSGLSINRFLSVEGLLGVVSEGNFTANNIKTVNSIDYYSSIRLRFNYHKRKMIPYLYLGYSGIHLTKTQTNTVTNAETVIQGGEAGFSYGIGIDLFGNRKTAIFVSTGVLLQNSDLSISSTIVGFRYYLSRQKLRLFR